QVREDALAGLAEVGLVVDLQVGRGDDVDEPQSTLRAPQHLERPRGGLCALVRSVNTDDHITAEVHGASSPSGFTPDRSELPQVPAGPRPSARHSCADGGSPLTSGEGAPRTEPPVGIEPTTFSLRVKRSAD